MTLICAPAVPRGPVGRADPSGTMSSGGVLGFALKALLGPGGCLSGPLEYRMPGPGGAGMRVAWAHGAAVAPGWGPAAVAVVALG